LFGRAIASTPAEEAVRLAVDRPGKNTEPARRTIGGAQDEEKHLEKTPHAPTENPIGDEQDESDPGREGEQFEKSEEAVLQ
jgi:hypothetical protein